MKALTDPNGFKANGADLALIEVEVVDKDGKRNPVAFNMIDFKLNGPAEWRGGIAQGPDNYILSQTLPVELGINRILIRSLTDAGKITLTASSKGLKSAKLELETLPVEIKDGLSTLDQEENLLSYLGRGPTPQTPSFTVTRNPVKIISASAGFNDDQSGLSFDDNEMTNWSNDNVQQKGWIKYEFDSIYNVSEITMKLNAWRRRSYPIEMKIGDKVVFKGETPRSLGYVTFPFEPVSGKSLTVKLMGATVSDDAYNIVEITGQKDFVKDGFKEANEPEGILSIIEIEVYEKVNP